MGTRSDTPGSVRRRTTRAARLAARMLVAAVAAGLPCVRCVSAAPPAEAYPRVALTPGSRPRYAALRVNPWTNENAYVLFDGTITNGYRRAYVWIPGRQGFDSPVAFTAAEGQRFGPFKIATSVSNESAVVEWSLACSIRVHGGSRGGTRTERDYVTGEDRVVTVPPSQPGTNLTFGFTCSYRYGPRVSGLAAPVNWPLDVTISHPLDTVSVWSNVPSAGLAPWQGLRFIMSLDDIERSKDKAGLSFSAALFYGNVRSQVTSLPADSRSTLWIRPYLEPPVFSNTWSGKAAFDQPTRVDLPYGWYDFACRLECRGLGVLGHRTDLRPLAKPSSPP